MPKEPQHKRPVPLFDRDEELEKTSGIPGAIHFGSNREDVNQARVGVGGKGRAGLGASSADADRKEEK